MNLPTLTGGSTSEENPNCFGFSETWAGRSHVFPAGKTGEPGSRKCVSGGERIIREHKNPSIFQSRGRGHEAGASKSDHIQGSMTPSVGRAQNKNPDEPAPTNTEQERPQKMYARSNARQMQFQMHSASAFKEQSSRPGPAYTSKINCSRAVSRSVMPRRAS